MKRLLLRRQLIAWVLVFLLATSSACRMQESDGDILTEISNQMHADHGMDRINAAVDDGVVTLTGTCPDERCRQHADSVAKNIKGVKEVVNKITIAQRDTMSR